MPVFLSTTDADFDARFQALLGMKREQAEDVDQAVTAIIAEVRARGDAALTELTARFDRLELTPDTLAFSAAEIAAACARVSAADPLGRVRFQPGPLCLERSDRGVPPPDQAGRGAAHRPAHAQCAAVCGARPIWSIWGPDPAACADPVGAQGVFAHRAGRRGQGAVGSLGGRRGWQDRRALCADRADPVDGDASYDHVQVLGECASGLVE